MPAACGERHRCTGDRLVELAGRTVGRGGEIGRRCHAGQHLDTRRGDVRLDEIAQRAARRERRHHVALSRRCRSGRPRRHDVRVPVDEGKQRRRRSVDVDRRQPVVVGLDVLGDGVVEDHPRGPARVDIEPLVDARVRAALAHDDLAGGSTAGREFRLAQDVFARDILRKHDRRGARDASLQSSRRACRTSLRHRRSGAASS